MPKGLITQQHLEDIADAIRGRNNSLIEYKPSEMAAAVAAIPNSYAAGDEGKVVKNGALIAQSARANEITANGTYDTTENNSVTVNVSGGGGDIPLLTRAQWNALTTAQKQAYSLIAIQDETTGFIRGELVNGADYMPLGVFLPYSNENLIICEAYPSIYNSQETKWGYGAKPILLSASGSVQNTDGSVTILTKTNGTLAYVDLGAKAQPFTAYIVAKVRTANSNYTRLFSAMASRGQSSGIMLYGTTVSVSSWASDTTTGISASLYFVGVIQYGGANNALGSAIASASATPSFITKSPYTAGQYLTIGRTDIDPSTTNAEPTDMDVLYFGVTTDVESQSVITQNMQYLAQQFLT